MHILLTGASSGIGRALALELARQKKARLTLAARRLDLLESLAEEAGCECHTVAVDLADPSNTKNLLDDANRKFGDVDLLINNAGVQIIARSDQVSWHDGHKLLQLNLVSPLKLINEALPQLKKGRGGLINVASIASFVSTPGMGYYSASKSGLGAFSETLHHELKGQVQVLTVYPGPIKTAMEEYARTRMDDQGLIDRVPMAGADELAVEILKSWDKKEERLIFPRSYAVSRHLPSVSQFFTNLFTPEAKDL